MKMPNLPSCRTLPDLCRTPLQVIGFTHKLATYPQTYPHFKEFAKSLIRKTVYKFISIGSEINVPNLAGPLAKCLISLCRTSFAGPAGPLRKSLILLRRTSAEPSYPPKGGDRDPHRVGGSLSRSARLGRSLRWLHEGVA
jgi:hypothetical protein